MPEPRFDKGEKGKEIIAEGRGMTEFILAWVLMNIDGHSAVTYSPPVKTLADCQRMQKFMLDRRYVQQDTQCIQVNVVRGK
ncbi:MAG: hypothetical protein ACOYKR_08380 [Sphingobacterium thalpophilum]